jgi:hypothetical protein
MIIGRKSARRERFLDDRQELRVVELARGEVDRDE